MKLRKWSPEEKMGFAENIRSVRICTIAGGIVF